MRRPSRRELLEQCAAAGLLAIVAPLTVGDVATAWARAERRRATPWNQLGPFYRRDAPATASLRASGDPGVPLAVSGVVTDVRGDVVTDARVEIWQADAHGHYDLDGFRYRAIVTPDAQGRYRCDTVIPGHYPGRVAQHVHFLVRAPGHAPLTTQLYFATDPAFDGDPDKTFTRDPVILSRELIRPVAIASDADPASAAVAFDLVLERR
jgi:protocatechuate 3,4-dioxygenase beta subunit